MCGVLGIATYFFGSGLKPESLPEPAFAARPLAAEEVDFVQSRAMWPAAPQKRQSLLSRHRLRSVGVSFPSFPRWEVVLEELDEDFWFLEPELELLALELLLPELPDLLEPELELFALEKSQC